MLLNILTYVLVTVVLPMALIYWAEYVKSKFDKKKRALENNIEKPTYVINNPKITIINNFINNTELPK
jgi:hypothetical protein